MASYTVIGAKHATLDGANGDVVRLTGTWDKVEVVNRHDSEYLYATIAQHDIAAIGAGEDESFVVPPGLVLTVEVNNNGRVWVALAGSSNPYSVQGVPS